MANNYRMWGYMINLATVATAAIAIIPQLTSKKFNTPRAVMPKAIITEFPKDTGPTYKTRYINSQFDFNRRYGDEMTPQLQALKMIIPLANKALTQQMILAQIDAHKK